MLVVRRCVAFGGGSIADPEPDLEEVHDERIIEAIHLLDVRLDRIESRLGTTPG